MNASTRPFSNLSHISEVRVHLQLDLVLVPNESGQLSTSSPCVLFDSPEIPVMVKESRKIKTVHLTSVPTAILIRSEVGISRSQTQLVWRSRPLIRHFILLERRADQGSATPD